MERDYVIKFFVGLLDGDGSIQVNHWRKTYLQYRFVIRLKYLQSNHRMLIEIAKAVGGFVRVSKRDQRVLWVLNDKAAIRGLLPLLEKWPPLTSSKLCKLAFLKKCLNTNMSPKDYFAERDIIYQNQSQIRALNPANPLPTYFGPWLSGFIEAEGCFSGKRFSIGQKGDAYLLKTIKDYLQVTNTISKLKGDFFQLHVYKTLTIEDHLRKNPLMGAKADSYEKFLKNKKQNP